MIKVLARISTMLIRVDRADLILHLPALQRASDKAVGGDE